MINKSSEKRSPIEIKHLQEVNKEITIASDIADTLAESFSEISSTINYITKFQTVKAHAERQPSKFS